MSTETIETLQAKLASAQRRNEINTAGLALAHRRQAEYKAGRDALKAELAQARKDLGEALSVPTLGEARAEIGGLRIFLEQHQRGAAQARRDDDIRYAAVAAELAETKNAEPTPCPVDHSCEGEQSCDCWCELHDVPIAECPTYTLVTSWVESRDRELAEARAAIERVEERIAGVEAYCSANLLDPPRWIAGVRSDLAALDTPQRPEDTRERPKLITGNGTRRDPHAIGLIHEDPEDTREETGP